MRQGEAVAPAPASPFALPEFRLYLGARFLATLAGMAMVVVLAWQVYDVARGPAYNMSVGEAALQLGLVGLVQFVPLALLTPVAGLFADRFERRTIARLANMVDVFVALALGALTASDAVTLPALFALAAAHGAARAFTGPAMSAIAPNIVPPVLLPKAIAQSSIAWQSASIAGPAVGGLLYGVDAALPYWLAAVAMSASALALTPIRRIVPPPMTGSPRPMGQIVDGLRYIGNHRFLLGAITLDLFAVILGGVVAVLPIYARDILVVGPEGLGWLRSGAAIGAAVVALWFSFLPLKRDVGVKMLWAVGAYGFFTMLFGLSTSFALSLFALIMLGAADMLSVYVRSSLVQLHTPDAMRGRVSAVSGLAISASNELGEARGGLFAALIGPVAATVAGGIGAIVVTLAWAWYFPELRRARNFAPPDDVPSEAKMQEKPA